MTSRELRPALTCPTCGGPIWSVVDHGASWYECDNGHEHMRRKAEENRLLLEEIHGRIAFKRRLQYGEWNV